MRSGYRMFWVLLAAAAFACAAAPSDVLAQASDPAALASISMRQIIKDGGSLMYVLAALSVLAVALIGYLFFILRASQVAPQSLEEVLVETIQNGSVSDARKACEFRPCPLSAVVLSALNYVRRVPDADPALLKDLIEGEGHRQTEALNGQTQYLLDVAVLAPMVGLLGTVVGMLQAFSAVALDIARAKPIVLAAGVSKALITTVLGLVIAIPTMAFYAYFRRRAANLVSQLEAAALDVLVTLIGKR